VFCVDLRTNTIVALYSIDWLAFVLEALSFLCEVRTEYIMWRGLILFCRGLNVYFRTFILTMHAVYRTVFCSVVIFGAAHRPCAFKCLSFGPTQYALLLPVFSTFHSWNVDEASVGLCRITGLLCRHTLLIMNPFSAWFSWLYFGSSHLFSRRESLRSEVTSRLFRGCSSSLSTWAATDYRNYSWVNSLYWLLL
jgi:hypothetical protein